MQASIYEREGDDQRAYLLLFRHAQLVLGHLPNHPRARQPENRLALAEAEKEVARSLARLEVLKPKINKRYDDYVRLVRRRDLPRATPEHGVETLKPITGDEIQRHSSPEPAPDELRRELAAGENRDLAVKIAHKEIQRRETVRRTTRQARISEHTVLGSGFDGQYTDLAGAFETDIESNMNGDLREQMRNVALQLEPKTATNLNRSRDGFSTPNSTLHYPSVPEKQSCKLWAPSPLQSSAPKQSSSIGVARPPKIPDLPRKEQIHSDSQLPTNSHGAPQLPPKSPMPTSTLETRSTTGTPTPSDLHPSTFTFKPSAILENGQPLRTIFLPPDLRSRFLSIASANTRVNLETCGILCGTLISNALFISKLVIPDQESTSDTCDTINESALFDYCDAEDLMVLGWIHTHPTQTCFMSSRDLHTHCGYQVMMPESIAIVCAPSKGE